jgi:hypothetical protein
MNASKSESSAVDQKTFQPVSTYSPVDHHRWRYASEEEIRKLIEEKTPKNVVLSRYPVTVIIYCQTERSFDILKILFSVGVHYILSPNIIRVMINQR